MMKNYYFECLLHIVLPQHHQHALTEAMDPAAWGDGGVMEAILVEAVVGLKVV